jgi:hypothetical protein
MTAVLDGILSIEHRQIGLSLTEDDHMLYLIKNGSTLAVWSALGATPENIVKVADESLFQWRKMWKNVKV